MADASKQFTLTMPGGSQFGTDSPYPLTLGPCTVERIIVSFPPGCANLVNCQIFCGGSPVYPYGSGTFFHFDNFQYIIPVTLDHLNGDWAIAVYNSDSIQHEIQVNIEYRYLQQSPTLATASPISV